ncbi:hypothetical protein T492DRAFT_863663 [Pavlovales sp. CCMP2436]|nr:hypothetical protein T492DRAFT_863663 [Pavlovales sp. CCMP2436]
MLKKYCKPCYEKLKKAVDHGCGMPELHGHDKIRRCPVCSSHANISSKHSELSTRKRFIELYTKNPACAVTGYAFRLAADEVASAEHADVGANPGQLQRPPRTAEKAMQTLFIPTRRRPATSDDASFGLLGGLSAPEKCIGSLPHQASLALRQLAPLAPVAAPHPPRTTPELERTRAIALALGTEVSV